MTVVVKRVPPPPPIAQNDPVFNRWLHDLTAFIAEGGGVDTGTIPGYDVLTSTVDLHSSQIAAHTVQIASNTSAISSLASTSATHTSEIAANTASIVTLTARSQVLNGTAAPVAGTGVDGDWYADTTAKHIHVKVSGAWVLMV